jgi:hypothetical protein
MWSESMVRFVCGGVFVSLFAMIGSVVKPTSFAGIFGAAPSVALAVSRLLMLGRLSVLAATSIAIVAWIGTALFLWLMFLR